VTTQAISLPRFLTTAARDGAVSERALVHQAQRGDRQAFGALVDRYQDRIFATLLRMTGSHDDALDLAQDAFVRAYTRLASFRGDSAFYTWLYRIAVNRASEWLRREHRRAPFHASGTEALEERAGPDDTAALAGGRVLVSALRTALGTLPAIYRSAVVLHDVDGLSHAEIAQVLGCAPGTARARLSRGRRLLRERMAEWV